MVDTGKPTRPFDVRVNSVDGKTVLVRGLDAFEMDDLSALIWRSCDGSRSASDIAALVAAEYDVEVARAQTDVESLIEELRSAGLLESV